MISEFLDKVFPLESVDESAKRDMVTREIELLANRWLQREDPTAPSAKLLTFGSSILGVTTNESDLDTVLLFPATISRETFFESFVTMLQTDAPDTLRVESLMAIPDAHVPVLKMVIMGLPVDILPCRVPVKHLRALLGSLDPITGQLGPCGPHTGGQYSRRSACS
jgi:poly(A) polymerase